MDGNSSLTLLFIQFNLTQSWRYNYYDPGGSQIQDELIFYELEMSLSSVSCLFIRIASLLGQRRGVVQLVLRRHRHGRVLRGTTLQRGQRTSVLGQVQQTGIVRLVLAACRRLVLLHGHMVVVVVAADLVITGVLVRGRLGLTTAFLHLVVHVD